MREFLNAVQVNGQSVQTDLISVEQPDIVKLKAEWVKLKENYLGIHMVVKQGTVAFDPMIYVHMKRSH